MKKIIKFIPLIYIFLFVLAGCQNVKEGLAGTKKDNNDEFLVEKKSPLTLPPDFAEIPEPGSLEKKTNEEKEKKAIEETFRIDKVESSSNSKTGSVEESILKKIGK